MWPEPGARALRLGLGLAIGVLLPSVLGCNAAVGAGLVVLAGSAGVLASQCYDEVRVRVRDEAGQSTCDADVTISDGDSVSSLRPCYHASLTEGRWRIDARREGYAPASTEIAIAEHEGACPHYTHTIELTLRRVGSPSQASQVRPPSPTPGAATPALAAPATSLVPPAGNAPGAPPLPPTAAFPAAPAPATPAAPAPAAASVPPAAPAPAAP
jgi:hypothetical protein